MPKKKGLPGVWALIAVYFTNLTKTGQVVVVHEEEENVVFNTEDGIPHPSAQPKQDQGGHGHGHEEFEFSEAMVHQGLETIEFVLGCVSHTASYLRLWALSLAHSELATVFWEKIIFQLWELGVTIDALKKVYFIQIVALGILSFVALAAWLGVTILVILSMEVLSAFLHALRLHWVEFQSKFYRGDGHAFKPFSYDLEKGED